MEVTQEPAYDPSPAQEHGNLLVLALFSPAPTFTMFSLPHRESKFYFRVEFLLDAMWTKPRKCLSLHTEHSRNLKASTNGFDTKIDDQLI